jgi:hypothetical protein
MSRSLRSEENAAYHGQKAASMPARSGQALGKNGGLPDVPGESRAARLLKEGKRGAFSNSSTRGDTETLHAARASLRRSIKLP